MIIFPDKKKAEEIVISSAFFSYFKVYTMNSELLLMQKLVNYNFSLHIHA